jgi:hypothetical protein
MSVDESGRVVPQRPVNRRPDYAKRSMTISGFSPIPPMARRHTEVADRPPIIKNPRPPPASPRPETARRVSCVKKNR